MEGKNNLSPCDGNCHIDVLTNCCISCFRTMKEIINWISFSESEKEEILKKIEQRKKLFKKQNKK